jgi:hypothetical protein
LKQRLTSGGAPRAAGLTAVCALLTCLLACALAGCRASDALVEVVYTQDAPTVDEDASQKNYELSDGAEQTLPLSQTTADEADDAREQVEQTVPVFGTEVTTDEPVEQVFYDENTGVGRTAPVFPDDPDDVDEDEERTQDVSDGGWDFEPEEKGQSEDDEAGADESDTAARGVSMHTDDPKVYNASGGLLAPLENVQCIATVGEYANMVLALGGPGTLVGADSGFLASEGAATIFSAEEWDFENIPCVWEYDEESGTYTLDLEALVAADPDLVWVPDGVELLSDDDRAALLELGINVEPAPAMSSVSAISQMATWLGSTLADHTVSGVDAAARAALYTDTYLGSDVDDLIAENGGLTTYGDVDYSGGRHQIASTTAWCVLVTGWDADATFDAGIWTDQGVAIATAGWGWSPVNYYLSVGGLNNNAAQFPNAAMAGKKSADYYVWQFNMSMFDPSKVSGYLAVADFGDTSYGWTQCLTGAPATVDRESTFTTSLGADDFRYLVCTTQAATEALTAARDAQTAAQAGLYAAYDYSVGAALQESGVGPRTSSGVLVRAVIGSTTSGTTSIGQDRVAAGENPYEVVTCANGLYADWVQGSFESFLMAFWTDCLTDAEAGAEPDYTQLAQEAARFYRDFYDYELTDDDIATICAGRVG